MTQVHKQPARSVRVFRSPKAAGARPGPLDRLLKPELFKALSDDTRARLVACIAKCGRGCSVGEVAECCAVDLSVVSRHLSLLATAGVLEATRDGRVVRYAVRYTELAEMFTALAGAFTQCCPPSDSACGCEGGPCDC